MTDFSFDRASLDSLTDPDKADAQLAADTAEILAGYYQQVAKKVVDRPFCWNANKPPARAAMTRTPY